MEQRVNPKIIIAAAAAGAIVGIWFQNFVAGMAAFSILLMPLVVMAYIPHAKENPNSLWFKRKLYGWGWTPISWQGWLITFCYVGAIVLFSLTINERSTPMGVVVTFFIPTILLTIGFVRIAYKTGEKPRWQWGKDKGDPDKDDMAV